MAYFEGIEMTGGYGNGPDILHAKINQNVPAETITLVTGFDLGLS